MPQRFAIVIFVTKDSFRRSRDDGASRTQAQQIIATTERRGTLAKQIIATTERRDTLFIGYTAFGSTLDVLDVLVKRSTGHF